MLAPFRAFPPRPALLVALPVLDALLVSTAFEAAQPRSHATPGCGQTTRRAGQEPVTKNWNYKL